MSPIRQVRKRDGRLVPFDRGKVAEAIFRAAQSVGGEDRFLAEELAGVVVARLHVTLADRPAGAAAGIEDVQDLVERVLIDAGHARTAKAYILYRERRAEARAARVVPEPDAHQEAPPPLVGDENSIRRFSKGALVERLLAEEAFERAEAEEVARAIEARVLRAHTPRVSEDLLDTLVRAELFERGWTHRALRSPREGVPVTKVRAALDRGPDDRRALDPAAVAESLGEALTERHVLEHVLPPAVAEAHRVGDLHVQDLGAPLRLTAIALSVPEAAPRDLAGEVFSRSGGVRRAFAAVEGLLLRYAPHAARVLALEDVNVWLAPFVAHLDEDALAEEVRQFLLSPALASVPRRGGLLRLELGLTAELPPRLATLDTPPPAPPGRRFGDYADAAFRLTRTFLREASVLRRQGHWIDCALTLVLARGGARDASRRALVRQALASAGEGGEPVILFDDAEAPSRGSRWLRVRESECTDPLRFEAGDVSAAGAVAINLVGAALRSTRGGGASDGSAGDSLDRDDDRQDDFIREIDRLVRLALDAADAKRSLLEGLAADPGGALYALRRGTHPLVDLEGAFHLVEIVGADRAAALLLPEGGTVDRLGMRNRIVRHVHGRVREQALARRLQGSVAEGLSSEAPARFAHCDAQRYPGARSWWPVDGEPTYARPHMEGPGLAREPLHPDRLRGGPSLLRVRHRVGGEEHPPVDDLLVALEAAEQDTAVLEYAVDPWPRRMVHREPPV